MTRPIHPDFARLLRLKDAALVELFTDLRKFVLELAPESNELLYHTHALTAVFSVSDKLSDAFCMLPIYTAHVNLGFNKGTLLADPHGLLTGTGALIRHVPVATPKDYRNERVRGLLRAALQFATEDLDRPTKSLGKTISKIKA
jgi:hypothetical protein